MLFSIYSGHSVQDKTYGKMKSMFDKINLIPCLFFASLMIMVDTWYNLDIKIFSTYALLIEIARLNVMKDNEAISQKKLLKYW